MTLRAALLLVDMQADFLERPGLAPPAHELTACVATLLAECRKVPITILHSQTLVRADGSDRMPHWKRNDTFICVEGTRGAQPPAALRPASGEPVFRKRYYSAFGDPHLHDALRSAAIDTLILAGVYLHGCVRSTALDAYERGLEVWVAADAVGSNEPAHAQATHDWLDGRAATFLNSNVILDRLRGAPVFRASEAPR